MPSSGWSHRDERDVVDLVHDVLAGVAGDRRLELAGQVRERLVADEAARDLVDLRRGVDELVGRDAGDRRAEHDARHVAARLGRAEADALEAAPDLGHVLDADPVELDVLAVGEVGGVAPELGRDARDHAELLGGQLPAVDAHAEHEVLVLELVRLEGRGPAAVDARLALRVEAPDPEASVQVGRVDRREPALRVDALDAVAHAQAVVDLLPLLVGVERLGAVDLPLSVRTGGGARRPVGAGRGGALGSLGSLGARRVGGRGIRRRRGGHGLLLPQRAHSARSWCSVEARRVRRPPTGGVSRPVTPCRIASHGVVVRHRGLRRRAAR